MNWKPIQRFLHFSHPLLLFDTVLVYALGAGIAHYLGARIDAALFVLGLAWTLSLQLSANYLHAYSFRAHRTAEHQLDEAYLARELPLWVSITTLTLTASFTFLLMRSGGVSSAVLLVMGLIALGAFACALPPWRLADTVFREMIISILIANFVPALAFMLQGEALHRLISMTTFPLTLLHFAMFLAFEFRGYAADLKYERQTLLVRWGWQRGMRLINLLILSTFLLLGLAMLVGLPQTIALPAFLVLPPGLILIWYLTRIAAGAKPHWTALQWLAASIFGLTAYLLAFSFWTR